MISISIGNTYETLLCAHAIAQRKAAWDYEHGGDGGFVVVKTGTSPHRDALADPRWAARQTSFADNFDDMPW
jgi:hypothetical protein